MQITGGRHPPKHATPNLFKTPGRKEFGRRGRRTRIWGWAKFHRERINLIPVTRSACRGPSAGVSQFVGHRRNRRPAHAFVLVGWRAHQFDLTKNGANSFLNARRGRLLNSENPPAPFIIRTPCAVNQIHTAISDGRNCRVRRRSCATSPCRRRTSAASRAPRRVDLATLLYTYVVRRMVWQWAEITATA